MADVMMAPAADMFEMGVNLQVLRRGTFFPLRARRLYDLYQAYDSLDAIPAAERRKLEQQVFQRSVDEVWDAYCLLSSPSAILCKSSGHSIIRSADGPGLSLVSGSCDPLGRSRRVRP